MIPLTCILPIGEWLAHWGLWDTGVTRYTNISLAPTRTPPFPSALAREAQNHV